MPNDCQQAIETILNADVFLTVFLAMFVYDGLCFIAHRLIRYVEHRSWGAAPASEDSDHGA
ncbi:hypothetical protein [Methylomonas sp. CM2]|uniref:hypothetical protein n=1 Tax=Methylomonas sp. CM2 TaxID=3417647 RepID=UPI003CE75F6A